MMAMRSIDCRNTRRSVTSCLWLGNILNDIWILHHNLYLSKCLLCPALSEKGTADPHRGYFCCRVTLMMLTAIAFPHHSHRKGQTKWEGCVSKACPPCHSLIWPQALWLMRPKHQHRVIISTREALNFFTLCLWGHCCSKTGEGGARCWGLSPKYAGERLFFFFPSPCSLVSWWM